MTQALLQSVEQSQLKAGIPNISVGDTVDVHYRIIEGSKERIQVFNGVVLKKQGSGLTETFTVRRIVANEGVERTFPIHSPKISKIEVKRHGHTRRSKLYYLRDRVGKSRRLSDRRRGLQHLEGVIAAPQKKRKKDKGDSAEIEVPTDAAPQVPGGDGEE